MKRASSVLLLLAAIIVAVFLVNRLGIFKRSQPDTPAGPPPMAWPHRPNFHNPAALIAAPSMVIHRAPVSTHQTKIPPLSQAEVANVLDDWTYPGAVIDGNELASSGSSKNSAAASTSRSLVTSAPQADVWRFYEAKAGSLGGNPSAPSIPSVAGISVSHISRNVGNCSITAVLFHQDGADHTQITLRVSPRALNQPS